LINYYPAFLLRVGVGHKIGVNVNTLGAPETPFDWETEESAAEAIKIDTSVGFFFGYVNSLV
jgi:hypothetical protein